MYWPSMCLFVYLFLHFCYVCIWRKVWRWCVYTSVYAVCRAERCTLIVMYKSRQMTERCTRCCVKFPTVTLIGICLNRTPSRQGHSARMKRNKRGEKNTVLTKKSNSHWHQFHLPHTCIQKTITDSIPALFVYLPYIVFNHLVLWDDYMCITW